MKKLLVCSLRSVVFAVFAQIGSAMNNDDVVKMVGAELAENTIAVAIEAAKPAEFDTSADALIRLKEKGVSEKLIQAMVKRQNAASAPAESTGTRVSVTVDRGGVSVATGDTRQRITFTPAADADVLPPEITPVVGKEYFTRHNFMFEDGEHIATNYWRGALVPINTKVQLLKLKKKSLTLEIVSSGETVEVENVPDYTKRTMDQIAKRLLAEKPVAIEKYGPAMATAIKEGELRLGMTKTQVLLARGYPPGHETPSLEGKEWKFWSSRFVTHTLVFDGDVLVEGRGLD